MRYVLTYPDPISIELVRAIVRTGSDEVAAAYATGSWQGELTGMGITTPTGPATEALGVRHVDAVIIGRGGAQEARSELARTLTQAEMPMIVVHPVGDMLFGFELQMAQAAAGTPILPFFPEMYHPLLSKVTEWIEHSDSSPSRRTQHVQMDRLTTDRRETAVEAQFCRDALLLRLLLGKVMRVSALRAWNSQAARPASGHDSSSTPSAPQSWSVQMLDEHGRDIRWNLQISSRDAADLTIHAAQESCKVVITDNPVGWTCTIGNQTLSLADGSAPFNPSQTALETMAAALQSADGRRRADQLWEHACRSVELADAVVRSSRRGRAIDLYHEEHTEENTFKGVMAAGGCVALFIALALIPVVAIGERILPEAEPGSRWLRLPWVLLLVVLAAFLAMQLLRLAIKRP